MDADSCSQTFPCSVIARPQIRSFSVPTASSPAMHMGTDWVIGVTRLRLHVVDVPWRQSTSASCCWSRPSLLSTSWCTRLVESLLDSSLFLPSLPPLCTLGVFCALPPSVYTCRCGAWSVLAPLLYRCSWRVAVAGGVWPSLSAHVSRKTSCFTIWTLRELLVR